jgi:hypothetical protein
MQERITRANVDERCANVNRRMEQRGSIVRYAAQGRNGYIGLDRYHAGETWNMQSTVTCGTKREVAEFLHAMMVALDDSTHTA